MRTEKEIRDKIKELEKFNTDLYKVASPIGWIISIPISVINLMKIELLQWVLGEKDEKEFVKC